jgi:hypothetical protein
MEFFRRIDLTYQVHGIGDKSAIPKPAVMVGWKGGTRHIGATGMLVFQDDLNTVLE